MHNILGYHYGRWTVVKYSRSVKNRHKWICRCSCGNIKEVDEHSLRYGRSMSCGCLRNEVIRKSRTNDISGLKYGLLTPLYPYEYSKDHGDSQEWVCRCDCGNTYITTYGKLKSRKKISCGCTKQIYLNGNRDDVRVSNTRIVNAKVYEQMASNHELGKNEYTETCAIVRGLEAGQEVS